MSLKDLAINSIISVIDVLSVPLITLTALVSKIQTELRPKRLPIAYKICDLFGVSPITYHYYEPIFNVSQLKPEIWTEEDPLFGIDFNIEGQLQLLQKFNYNTELEQFPIEKPKEDSLSYYYENIMFFYGDAEIFYSMIRHFKPSRIIEIGSGFSTRIAKQALAKNRLEGKNSQHICIEPYEAPWLEKLGVDEVIRKKVEDLPLSYFECLEENDILFIDSSHVLRTGGDVVYEYLRILPKLKSGVLIHIHDVFLPFEYPREWIQKQRCYWTEQYLVQAFLVFNSEFEVLLAVNYLKNCHKKELYEKCPMLAKQDRKPLVSSFWLRRK